MSFDINKLLRDNIKNLEAYSSARDEFTGTANVFLDANENSLGSPLEEDYSRYPDPHQQSLKAAISDIKNIPAAQIFLGNGSDECIDVLYRAFCNPSKDNVITLPPTYGMYGVSAAINDVAVKKIALTTDFQIDVAATLAAVDANTKIIWLCSPNNPSANLLKKEDVVAVIEGFANGIVVVDEAYIDFAAQESFIGQLKNYPNLVVMQTFSKAWGMAGLRLGLAYASMEIITIMNKIKPPYNINQETQRIALDCVKNVAVVKEKTVELIALRESLVASLSAKSFVQHIYPSDANFLLVKFANPLQIYNTLVEMGIIVRDRHKVQLCDGCLRITVGTAKENEELLTALQQIHSK